MGSSDPPDVGSYGGCYGVRYPAATASPDGPIDIKPRLGRLPGSWGPWSKGPLYRVLRGLLNGLTLSIPLGSTSTSQHACRERAHAERERTHRLWVLSYRAGCLQRGCIRTLLFLQVQGEEGIREPPSYGCSCIPSIPSVEPFMVCIHPLCCCACTRGYLHEV